MQPARKLDFSASGGAIAPCGPTDVANTSVWKQEKRQLQPRRRLRQSPSATIATRLQQQRKPPRRQPPKKRKRKRSTRVKLALPPGQQSSYFCCSEGAAHSITERHTKPGHHPHQNGKEKGKGAAVGKPTWKIHCTGTRKEPLKSNAKLVSLYTRLQVCAVRLKYVAIINSAGRVLYSVV